MIIKIFLVSFVLSFAHCNEIRLSSTDEKLPPHEEDRIFNGQKQKQSGMQYQILRGHYLTTFRAKRSADNDDEVRPPVMALSVPVEGRDVNLVLEQTDIAHPNIVIQLDSDNSGNVNLKPWLNCFYSGGHGDVWAVVSTCDGLNAIIHNRKKSYQLEEISTEVERGRRPKRDSPGSRFVIFPLEVQRGGYEKRGGGVDVPVSLEEPEEHHLPKLTVGNELSRSKRSVIKGPYTVELAVFVDHALYKYIKKRFPNSKDPKKKTVEIVMTLINAVHRMYSHSSLGNSQVSMVVKTVRKLNEGTPNHAKGDIYAYLTNFSKWQKKNNPSSSKKQWDHALLLTGVDLWSENKADNSTVGLAYVGGMCSKGFSCTINEASTLAAAYIIAHELGHNFNMKHDGIATAKSCPGDKYIMASVMASGATEWSSCSKKAISSFLKDKGYCLTPEKTTVSKEGKASHRGLPPGKRFDANEQCSYMYGLKWKHFKDNQKPFDNVCKEIWCRNSRILRTPSAPALEGTPCGKGKTCKDSKCIAESSDNNVVILTTTKPPPKNDNPWWSIFDDIISGNNEEDTEDKKKNSCDPKKEKCDDYTGFINHIFSGDGPINGVFNKIFKLFGDCGDDCSK